MIFKFFAIIGILDCLVGLIRLSLFLHLKFKLYLDFKKVASKINIKEINKMIKDLPKQVNSKASYEKLFNFSEYMLTNFPGVTLKRLEKLLSKDVIKEMKTKLPALFESNISYIEKVLELIYIQLQKSVEGEFTIDNWWRSVIFNYPYNNNGLPVNYGNEI